MILETRAVEPFYKNGFVVGCEDTREAVMIDPGDEVDALLAAASQHGLSVKAILLTHAHLDHVTGVAKAKAALAVPVWLHKDDNFLYEAVVQQGQMFGLRVDAQPPIDHFYDTAASERERTSHASGAGLGAPASERVGGSGGAKPPGKISFGRYSVRVLHTPGHCPGGVCLAVTEDGGDKATLFVGDTLFAGSIGRTDLPGGNMDTLLRSIREVLFQFPDDTVVWSGHGEPTTIGREKRTNPFLV